jgi:predicted nucleotidyltransferase
MNNIEEARVFSEGMLGNLRDKLSKVVPEGELVITCGSYARREASRSSDLDFYSVTTDGNWSGEAGWQEEITKLVNQEVGKLPSTQGAFATNIPKKELLENYGGSNDSNETITRRMLYLLEGEYLTNEAEFKAIRRQIIERYVKNTPSDHQIAFYFLNDVVRYWRTMAVDYADKTYGARNPKPWAIRNIKLVFSRKLIYASGLFSIALTADRTLERKIEILDDLFSRTPIERIKYVCGQEASKRLFELYDVFLGHMSDPVTRDQLDKLDQRDRFKNKWFRDIKNEGHYFSRELMSLLQKTFHASHPIHMAVVF